MTIAATASETSYAGDGVSTVFPIPFIFDTSADIKVIQTDSSGNPVVLSSGFTVAGGGGSTGSLTLLVALASGSSLTILDNPERTQTADYIANDDFAADSHERALDRGVRISKRIYQLLLKCIRVDDGDPASGAGTLLGSVQARKGKYLFFNAVTGAIEYATAVIGSTLSQSIIGQFLNPQTSDEATAGVTPVNYAYPSGDVRRYGTVGDGVTDDSVAIQKAYNVARYSGRVHFPEGSVYRCHGITVYEGTLTTADEGVILEKNGGGAFTTHIFDCISTLGTGTALSGDATIRGQSVGVTSASGLSVGQCVLIRDSVYKWSTNARNLEFNEIESIVGTTITLRNRLIGSYATAQSAELVPLTVPARKIRFENVRCRIPSTEDGGAFYFQEAYDCELVTCSSSGQKGQPGFMAWRSAYVRVRGGVYSDGQSQSTPGYGYGGAFSQSSHHCWAIGVTFRNVRECAVSLGARFSGYIDCESHSSYDNSFNSHADGSEDCFFINCRSYFARSKGFYAGGVTAQAADKRIRFINCVSYYSGYIGFWADGASGIESEDIEFNGCEAFHPGDDTATSFGFYAFRSTRPRIINCRSNADGEANVRSLVKVEICTDALVRGGDYRGATSGWGIIHATCTGVTIEDNNIANIGSSQGVQAESTASTKVYIRRNKADNDVNFTRVTGDILVDNEWNTKRQEARGSTSVADGGTITHGLIATPTSVRVTATTSGEFASVTAKGSSTFTVAIKKHDGTAGTTANVDWYATYD